jgi:hypothetical protein
MVEEVSQVLKTLSPYRWAVFQGREIQQLLRFRSQLYENHILMIFHHMQNDLQIKANLKV